MPESNESLGTIDLNQPFSGQPNIQLFLGEPEESKTGTTVSSELLYRFLQLVEQVLIQENQSLSEQKSTLALKIGYERKVFLNRNDNQYKIESHFVCNQNWTYEHELDALRNVNLGFLSPVEHPSEQEDSLLQPEKKIQTHINLLAERIYKELSRLYSQLADCEDLHLYILPVILPRLESTTTDGSHLSKHPIDTLPPLQSPGDGIDALPPLQSPGDDIDTLPPLQSPGDDIDTLPPLQSPGGHMRHQILFAAFCECYEPGKDPVPNKRKDVNGSCTRAGCR